jgi:hypothetical protein
MSESLISPGAPPLPSFGRGCASIRRSIPVDDCGSVCTSAIDSGRPTTRPRPSSSVDDSRIGRIRAVDSRRPAPPPRPKVRVDQATSSRASVSRKPSTAAANKELEDAENEIQRLNELRLGDNISYEEYAAYCKQLAVVPDVDTSSKLMMLSSRSLKLGMHNTVPSIPRFDP